MSRPIDRLRLAGLLALLASCSEQDRVAGNSANTGNAQAAGRIVVAGGAPASGVWIDCQPESLTPWDSRQPGWTSVTDSSGAYRCVDLPAGAVGITAYAPGSGLSRWRHASLVADVAATIGVPDTLAASGTLRIALPPQTIGTVYLTGLSRSYNVRGDAQIEIRDLPADWRGDVRIARSVTSSQVVDSALHVAPGGVDSAGFTRARTTLRIPLAGGLTSSLAQLPVLVRLDSSWTGFVRSLDDGADLRLSTTSGTALPLDIARWDRAGRSGALWTLLDSVKAPGDSVEVILSWGLPVPATTPARSFSAAAGWLAVWPLGDSGSLVSERLGSWSGTPTAITSVPGVIGAATHFDGRTSKIQIAGSTGGNLDLPEKGPYTLSCWARLQSFATSRFLMGRGEYGSYLKFQHTFGADTNNWLASDARTSPAGGFFNLAKADTGTWQHVLATVSGDSVRLYVNGILSSKGNGTINLGSGRKDVPFLIGAAIDTLGGTGQHFLGDLEEAWVQNVVRSPEWIRFVAANQSPKSPAAKPTD